MTIGIKNKMGGVIVFGSNGMLGRYMTKVISKRIHVSEMTRLDYDIVHNDSCILRNKLRLMRNNYSVVVNCAGTIPQRINNDVRTYIAVNTLFPLELAKICNEYDYKLIHITTDCVFDGEKGSYDEIDLHTEKSIYGVTKSLGEPREHATIIRTSIIGEEKENKKSLLEWVRSQSGEIDGFTNHMWNGITCLQLAKIVDEMIDCNNYWTGVRHIFSPQSVSKYELCKYINDEYNLGLNIQSFTHDRMINKTLSSIYPKQFNIKPIEDQIREQKQFGEEIF